MLNGTMNLKAMEMQKKHPKGSGVETDYASAYKELGKELISKYPYKGEAKKMKYGSQGEAFGA